MTDKFKRIDEMAKRAITPLVKDALSDKEVLWLISELKLAWKQNEELVAALEVIVNYPRFMEGYDEAVICKDLFNKAREALAKFRGDLNE